MTESRSPEADAALVQARTEIRLLRRWLWALARTGPSRIPAQLFHSGRDDEMGVNIDHDPDTDEYIVRAWE